VRVLSDRALRDRLVASARERVKRFSIDATVAGTLREYELAAGAGDPGAAPRG
jgi:hypothetical protein